MKNYRRYVLQASYAAEVAERKGYEIMRFSDGRQIKTASVKQAVAHSLDFNNKAQDEVNDDVVNALNAGSLWYAENATEVNTFFNRFGRTWDID